MWYGMQPGICTGKKDTSTNISNPYIQVIPNRIVKNATTARNPESLWQVWILNSRFSSYCCTWLFFSIEVLFSLEVGDSLVSLYSASEHLRGLVPADSVFFAGRCACHLFSQICPSTSEDLFFLIAKYLRNDYMSYQEKFLWSLTLLFRFVLTWQEFVQVRADILNIKKNYSGGLRISRWFGKQQQEFSVYSSVQEVQYIIGSVCEFVHAGLLALIYLDSYAVCVYSHPMLRLWIHSDLKQDKAVNKWMNDSTFKTHAAY